MKFTDKFTFITVSVVLTCITLVLVGGLLSMRALSLKYHQQRMDSIINVIESQLDKQAGKKEFDLWLPDLLDASGIVRLQIKRHDRVLYQNYYETRDFYPTKLLISYQYQLEKYPNVSLNLETRQPYDEIKFSVIPLLGISLAILFSLTLLFFSIGWIKKQFNGAELLERRAKYLLQNNPTARFAQPGEWPVLASKALDLLSNQLEQSKKERSYFDAHIRSQAFLDSTTGLPNQLAFENRLDVLAMDQNVFSSALLLISFPELESLHFSCGNEVRHKMLQQIADLLIKFSARYEDQFQGRTAKSEFVLIISQLSYQETEVVAKQLCKLLFQLQLPDSFSIDQFFYIGVVNFHYGEKPLSIMDDLNRALLVARQQKCSGWFLADQRHQPVTFSKGTVRWRALLENVLQKDELLLVQQSIIKRDQKSELYCELWPRIRGFEQELVAASVFLPMAEKCGLDKSFDRKMLEKAFVLLVQRGISDNPIAVNLSCSLLLDKESSQWFMYELMQLPRALRHNLVVEVSEKLLQNNYVALRHALNLIQKIGCKIAIDNVGKSVVNSEYILDFNIDYLKLHSSLIRDIHLRKTNQIAVQSLMASCLNSPAKIIAVGIETDAEWRCLLKLGIYAGQGQFFAALLAH